MKINIPMLLLKILIIIQYVNLVADLFPSFVQIIVFVLFLLSICNNKKVISEGLKISYISLLIFIVVLLRCVIADRLDTSYYSPFQNVIVRYQFFVYPFIFGYINTLNNKMKKEIFKIAIISILITVIVSFYYMLFVDPQAVRNTQGVYYWGVGDFQLMYAIAILIGPLFMLISENKRKKKKTFYLVFALVLMLLCLILCNLVTTWIIVGISVGISAFLMIKSKLKYTLTGIVLFVIIAIRSSIAKLLYLISESGIFYWSTSNKIAAIANVLSGNFVNIDTLSRRMMLINQSLTSFSKHPLFGINFKEHIMGNIGCHSQWADDLARYGIIGNFIIFLNYIKVAKYTISHCTNYLTRKSMICAWITTFILGFLNPCLSGTILMAIFVLIPTIDSVSEEEKNEVFSCKSI